MLNWTRGGNLSAHDIAILHHALFYDTTFSLGAIVAKRLNLNRTKGPILRGIFASRLAAHFNIPIRHHLGPMHVHCYYYPRRLVVQVEGNNDDI